MKKIILTLKTVAFILACVSVKNVHTQNFNELKKKYFNMTELAFKVRIVYYDEFKIGAGLNEKFYTVKMPLDKPHQWINYHISHVDTLNNLLSVYQPEYGRVIAARNSDTFKLRYKLNKWDTIYHCLQDPVSHNQFSLSFPFVECFYPDGAGNLNFKDKGTSYLNKDSHPATNFRRSVWISKTTGLVDSIWYKSKNTADTRIYFDYYYTRSQEGITNYNPLPYLYPTDSTNPDAMKYVNKPEKQREITVDTTSIQSLTTRSGKLFLMDFWYIGCQPCHAAFPIMEKLRRDYPEDVLKIVGYNYLDRDSEIKYFRKKKRIGFDMEYDSLGIGRFYKVRAYPTTILFSEKGEILYRHAGLSDTMEEDLRRIIDAHLRH